MSKPEVPNILMTDDEVEALPEDTYSTRGPEDYVVTRPPAFFTGVPMRWAEKKFGVRLRSGHYEPAAGLWIFVIKRPQDETT